MMKGTGMRVLHVGKFYPPFPGGMENFMGDLLPALERRGVTTAALVHHHEFGKRTNSVRDREERIDRVPSYGNFLYTPVSPGFPLALKRVIRAFRPHILHLHVPNTSAFWVMAIPAAARIPWVVQWQSDIVRSVFDRRLAVAYNLYRPLEQRLLGRAAVIVSSSLRYLESSEPLSPWRGKCRVVPLGIDGNRLCRPDREQVRWAEESVWHRGCARILSVGRLTYYKGHEILIQAASHMPDVHVVIVGQGDRKKHLKQRIAELGLDRRVTLQGFVPDHQIRALLATCDMFCLPSIERTEAFGLVILEAMGYEKPVVASDVEGSGMGWIVRHGETGFLVPPGNPRAMADALSFLTGNPDVRRRMSQAALERFDSDFHIDRVAREIHAMYEDVLSSRET
ncbi:MAG TPA: glycosyltransferase [Syntrophales bacterium]|nr:glycosyltransferase [Syntrophales bacterium]